MDLLLIYEKNIYTVAPKIEFGVYDEPIEKWAMFDENGKVMWYAIDHNFTLVEDVELPSDYEDGKYFYENGEFVLNEDWKPFVPEQSMEERIAELEKQLENLNGDAVWDEMALAIEEGVNEVD